MDLVNGYKDQNHLPLAWNSWALYRERVGPRDRFCHISLIPTQILCDTLMMMHLLMVGASSRAGYIPSFLSFPLATCYIKKKVLLSNTMEWWLGRESTEWNNSFLRENLLQ